MGCWEKCQGATKLPAVPNGTINVPLAFKGNLLKIGFSCSQQQCHGGTMNIFFTGFESNREPFFLLLFSWWVFYPFSTSIRKIWQFNSLALTSVKKLISAQKLFLVPSRSFVVFQFKAFSSRMSKLERQEVRKKTYLRNDWKVVAWKKIISRLGLHDFTSTDQTSKMSSAFQSQFNFNSIKIPIRSLLSLFQGLRETAPKYNIGKVG